MQPRASVVIPTYNRLARLRTVLSGLEGQTCPLDDFEVVVVSDGSTDGTAEVLGCIQTRLHLQFVEQPNRGVAAARNAGLDRAGGDLVLFLDDDVMPGQDLVGEHLRTHSAHGEDVIVIGPMLSPPGFRMSPWVRWEQAMLERQYREMEAGCWEPTARQFYTGNASVSRSHLVAAGGFDPAFRRAEDVELAYRLADRGLRFVFHPRAVGYHYAQRSFAAWFAIPYAYGRNDVIFSGQKSQGWLLETIWREFYTRNILVQLLTWICLDRARLSQALTAGMKQAALFADRLGLAGLSNLPCSGIFNLQYYQGIADHLGGRRAFFDGVFSVRRDRTIR